jgi:DNA-binding transcriptional LysR family regulator
MAEVDLDDVAVFVRVVDLGAFARAARELGVPTSTVSRTIARLEEKVGTMLLRRTSRSLQPTLEGRAFYAQVAPAVATVRAAARAFEGTDAAPQGTLRITAPNDLATICLADLVVAFTERYPLVRVEMVLTTRVVQLVEEGVDVALRAGPGPLPDSSLVARKLPPMDAALYASPGYVARHGAPSTPEQLDEHACVLFRPHDGEVEWSLRGPAGAVRKKVRGRVSADDLLYVREATVAGAGIANLPRIFAMPLVAEGRLTRVLRDHLSGSGTIHVLYAPSRVVPAKIAVFRDFVFESFERMRAAAEAADA